MLKISRLETKFQEIVFLLTITFSLSVAVGGIFYLGLTTENFISVSGETGSSLIRSGFSSFGYSYFFFIIFMLHMGHLVLGTANYFREVIRSSRVYFKSFAIYFTVILLISSFLTVLENYNSWEASGLFAYGHGGWFGSVIGGFLFKSFGLYGAMVILFSLTSVLGISAGYMEIVHSFYVMKDILGELYINVKTQGPVVVKELSNRVIDFIDQSPEYAAGAEKKITAPQRRVNHHSVHLPRLHQGGRLATEHYHIFKKSQGIFQESEPIVDNTDSQISIERERVVPQQVEEVKNVEINEVKEEVKKKRTRSRKKKDEEVVAQEVAEENSQQEGVDSSEEVKEDFVQVKAWRKRYKKLDISLLEGAEKRKNISQAEMTELCSMLANRLESFGIKGEIIKAHQGVTLTMFEFQPAAGMKLSKIQSLSDDLALVLGAKAIRILTPIPGKMTVGIEVPNKEVGMLRFSEMIATCLKEKKMELPIPLGIDVYNKAHVNDLTKMPHILVSGTTGSGKSVFMNSLISGLIFHKSPKELRFLMIDPKMIELSPYNGIPHLLKPVVTDVMEAKEVLLWAEQEMDRRYQIFSDMQAKNITSFNQSVKKGSKRAVEGRLGKKVDWNFEEMPYIVIVIDELADLMLTQGKEVERPITRIAQKARAAGIHMVMATQRPSSDIVTGLIKTNFPTRVSFKVSSGIDSRTIIDQSGAEKLLGNGDMLYLAQGKSVERLQGSFMSEDEVKKVVRSVSSQK